jgi:hypothetical protein
MTGPSAYRYRPAAVLEATGDDVSSFLQGQFSNDLKPFSPGKVTYGLWLDAKGKVEADSFVIEREGGKFLIMSPRCSAEALRARLERFIIADDVTLTDRTERWSSIVVWGEGAESAAVLLKVEVPAARAAYDGGAVIGFQSQRWGEGTIEWLFESSEEESGASPDGLVEGGFRLLTEAGAEQERILRGGVAVPDELGAADLPKDSRSLSTKAATSGRKSWRVFAPWGVSGAASCRSAARESRRLFRRNSSQMGARSVNFDPLLHSIPTGLSVAPCSHSRTFPMNSPLERLMASSSRLSATHHERRIRNGFARETLRKSRGSSGSGARDGVAVDEASRPTCHRALDPARRRHAIPSRNRREGASG